MRPLQNISFLTSIEQHLKRAIAIQRNTSTPATTTTRIRPIPKMKFVLALVMISVIVAIQAQLNLGLGLGLGAGRMGPPPPQFFQNVILQSEAQKLLTQPDFPADLQQRVLDTMSNSELGFNDCAAVSTLPWFQMRCVALQLAQAKNELKAIDDEAKARAQAAAAASAAEADAGASTTAAGAATSA